MPNHESTPMASTNVAVLGASSKPERYAYKAMQFLQERGYEPIPINPKEDSILGYRCFPSLRDVDRPIDTVTVYLSAKLSTRLADDILAAQPRRIIFNPGAENDGLEALCKQHGIRILRACTLVLLRTGQFESVQGEL